jgi:hypothetical protein
MLQYLHVNYFNTLMLQYYDNTVYSGALMLQYYNTVLQYSHVTILQYYNTQMLQHYNNKMYCDTLTLQQPYATTLSCYITDTCIICIVQNQVSNEFSVPCSFLS